MLGIKIGAKTARPAIWWPHGVPYAADFITGRYMSGGAEIAAATAMTLVRATGRLAVDSAGRWHTFAPGTPAITDLGLSLESAATNHVPNSAMAGAVPGLLGAGGRLPTGWSIQNYDAVTVTGLGTEAGLPFVELRLQAGNSGSSTRYALLNIMPAPASANIAETWTFSAFFRRVAGAWHPETANTLILTLQEVGTTSTYPSVILPAGGMTTLSRQTRTWTTSRPGSILLHARILQTALAPGENVDISVRVMAPMLTRETQASSPIMTSGSVSSRAADELTLHLPAVVSLVRVTHAAGMTDLPISGSSPILPTSIALLSLAALP